MCGFHCGGEFKPADKMSKEVLIKLIKQNVIVANDIEEIILKTSKDGDKHGNSPILFAEPE